jgi:hypothetical protein
MTEERISPLRQRMMEDMRIRGMGDKAQKSHMRRGMGGQSHRQSRISRPFWGDHLTPRRPKTCEPISSTCRTPG